MHNIYYNEEVVGKAEVTQKGLYYQFACRYRLPGKDLYRLQVFSGGVTADLGICVPADGRNGSVRSVPVKKIGTGDMEFRLVPAKVALKHFPVSETAPFPYLNILRDSAFCVVDGNPVICQREMSKRTGQ